MKNLSFLKFFIVFLSFAFSGCLVSENNSLPDAARVRLLNAVPDKAYTLSFNDDPLFTNVPFDSITRYGYVFPDFYNINISSSGGTRNIAAKQVIQSDIKYSFFIFPDSTSRPNNITGFKYSIITDNRQAALQDSFYIRFLHYSPTAPTLYVENLKRRGLSNIYDLKPLSSFSQRRFNDVSVYSNFAGFQKLPVGGYIFRLRNLITPDSAQVLATQLRTFSENRFYTMYLEGFVGETTGSYQLKLKLDSLLNTNN